MINSIRNTVLAVLNKANYGYLSPQDFNLYAKQAQLDLFENLFYSYNNSVNQVNARTSGTGHADLLNQIQEEIETFSTIQPLTHLGGNAFNLPDEWFTITDILTSTNKVVDKVSQNKITYLLNSHLTAPTLEFPVYILSGNIVIVYPDTINMQGLIDCSYIRYPKDPKWTWLNLDGGEPVFNQSQPDYQDFELSKEYEVSLIIKIAQYAGVSIREAQVVNYFQTESQIQQQEEQ